MILPAILLCLSPLTFAASVRLGNATIVGTELTELGQDFFGGIPFAEPPIGSLRFKAPVLKPSPDAQNFDATNFGPSCLQVAQNALSPPVGPKSEDCLSINIFRPSNARNLPVMVWIYGGGFNIGTASQYNATHLVSQSISRGTPIIYVSLNYRLGPLGFPQGGEAARRGALNLGLKDQLVALEWIQKNIAALGLHTVTVFDGLTGPSDGCRSVTVRSLAASRHGTDTVRV